MNPAPALILIDIQKGFDEIGYWGNERNNPMAEEHAGELLLYWRKKEWPLFHIRHCSLTPGSPLVEGKKGNAFKDLVLPAANETVIRKSQHSAFIGTTLNDLLKEAGIQTVVLAGLTTDQCVSTTARMASDYGYKTYIVQDATATFDKVGVNGTVYSAETIHQSALASLYKEFAEILSTREISEKATW